MSSARGVDVYGGVQPAWAGDGRSRPLSRRKGLSNELGSNNCFLNVVIQSLWHVRSCRVLIAMGDHAVHHRCGGEATNASSSHGSHLSDDICLLCELEQIFILYQFSEQPVLDVDRVRLALGDTFALGAMNDATETLEAILDALHYDTFNRMLLMKRGVTLGSNGASHNDLTQSVRADAAAIICEPQCVAHLLFQMNLMELKACSKCGETTEPLMNTDFLYRVYAQELLTQVHAADKKKPPTLEEVLCREAQGVDNQGFMGKCDACKGQMQMSRWILTLPMVFAISIIWSSDQVNKAEVRDWMNLLSTQNKASTDSDSQKQTLDLSHIFRLDNTSGVSSEYSFRGMVCYYGRHYVGFFASRSLEDGKAQERWFLFDDTRVKRVGTWADVRLRVERGGYQPTLLFYERNGIDLDKLESTASSIHKWWETTAEERAKTVDTIHEEEEEEEVGAVGGGGVLVTADVEEAANGVAPSVPPSDLFENLNRSVRLESPDQEKATTSVVLPTSPIRVPKNPPMSEPAPAAPAWHDEDLHLMHLSAQDTLSRLNGILSKDRSTTSVDVDGREVFKMAMSMSMRQSVRRRDYTVHRPAELDLEVNRDAIFMDDDDETASTAKPATTATSTLAEKQIVTEPKQLSPQKTARVSSGNDEGPLKVFDVELRATDGGIGLLLDEERRSSEGSNSNRQHIFTVSGFEVNGAGAKLPAEASGKIEKGDVLVGINSRELKTEALYDVLELLLTATSPVRLTFHRYLPWQCPRCTLLNDTKAVECLACGYTK